jgi:hypothetical protein
VSTHAGKSKCPLCGREWLVKPFDDCGLPSCGCYGHDISAANPARPCERCSINHSVNCEKSPAYSPTPMRLAEIQKRGLA